MKFLKLTRIIMLASLFTNLSANGQDWANLGRFSEENAKLPAPSKNEKRVVFMGNSITEGWGNLYPAFFKDKPYINRGISGQTTPQMLIRFRPDVINLKPAVVVVLAGANDIAGNTGPSTLEMIADNIEYLTWAQYTPYFNDGDTCRFYVCEASFVASNGDEYGQYGDKHDYDNILRDIDIITDDDNKDIMILAFGDHATVKVYKDGRCTVEECDHE